MRYLNNNFNLNRNFDTTDICPSFCIEQSVISYEVFTRNLCLFKRSKIMIKYARISLANCLQMYAPAAFVVLYKYND